MPSAPLQFRAKNCPASAGRPQANEGGVRIAPGWPEVSDGLARRPADLAAHPTRRCAETRRGRGREKGEGSGSRLRLRLAASASACPS